MNELSHHAPELMIVIDRIQDSDTDSCAARIDSIDYTLRMSRWFINYLPFTKYIYFNREMN